MTTDGKGNSGAQSLGQMANHPTVRKYYSSSGREKSELSAIDTEWLRALCLDAGADDVGFVDLEHAELGSERERILQCWPRTRSLISLVVRMNREDVRNPARSLANTEFHHAGDEMNDLSRGIVRRLEGEGIRAVYITMGFPMEIQHYPNRRPWVVSHKLVAVAAGLGHMGIHRSVIHPKFGSFILLGTILMELPLTTYSQPLDYNPCLSCKLCVSACPMGAIAPDGYFNFSACMTHNYREFMGGFQDWVDSVVKSSTPEQFTHRVTPGENASMWQSLSFGANYKAAYCMAVCPAGEDVIGPFLENRQDFLKDVVKPLQEKKETVYVVPGSDAEGYVTKRYPHKTLRRVHSGLNPQSIEGFLYGLRIIFQPEKARGLNATYQFRFTGSETLNATVTIKDRRVTVTRGTTSESADLIVTADSRAWIKFLANRIYLIWALVTRQIRLYGSPRLLLEFGRCFVR